METKKNSKKTFIIVLVASLLITNLLTFYVSTTFNLAFGNKVVIDAGDKEAVEAINKMVYLNKLLKNDFYKELNDKDLWNMAIKGMFAGTGDDYTSYYTKEEFESYTSSFNSSYSGIGVVMMQSGNGATKIDSVMAGSPAESAGVKAKDIIVKVDDKDVTKNSSSEISNMVKGKAGTKVKLTVMRNHKEKSFTITRKTIKIKVVESRFDNENKIAYISIKEFISGTYDEFKSHYNEAMKKGAKAIVLDLRDNGGGMVTEATNIANMFLTDGDTIISTTNKSGKKSTLTDDTKDEVKIPVAVLINENTASSSEILASALKDNGKATLIGTKSYGKGIIQEVKEVPVGGGVTITTDEYVGANGEKIHGKGITPDIKIKNKVDKAISQLKSGEDLQLQKAIDYLKKKIK